MYFFKAKDEPSEAMKQAARVTLAGNKSDYEKMKTKRECSVHKAVYLVMPGLWFHKQFPAIIFLKSYMPGKRYKTFKKKDDIDELPDDSTDMFYK